MSWNILKCRFGFFIRFHKLCPFTYFSVLRSSFSLLLNTPARSFILLMHYCLNSDFEKRSLWQLPDNEEWIEDIRKVIFRVKKCWIYWECKSKATQQVREKLSYMYGRILQGSLTGPSLWVAGSRAARDKGENPYCFLQNHCWCCSEREQREWRRKQSDVRWALARKHLGLWTKKPLAVCFLLCLLSDCQGLEVIYWTVWTLHLVFCSYILKTWLPVRCCLVFVFFSS